MKNSQLLQTIATLSAAERRELGRWADSPAFNQRPELSALWALIHANVDKNPAALRKEAAWESLFPGQAFDAVRMDLLMSYLLNLVREWLQFSEWRQEPGEAQLYLLRALRKRGLLAQFEKEAAKTERLLEGQNRRDAQYFRQKHRLEQERQQHHVRTNRGADLDLSEGNKHLTTSYLLETSLFLCSAASLATVSRRQVDSPEPLTLYQSAAEQGLLDQTPGLVFYRDMLEIVRLPDNDAAFQRVKAFLKTEIGQFSQEEARNAFLAALNFCIRNANAGRREYLRESFEICKMGIETRALFEGFHLSPFTYKNVVTAGLSVGEMDWVRQFLEDYKAHLPARERQSAYLFNLAVWNFRKPDNDAAMTLLRDSDFSDDPLTALAARAMLLRIYVEKDFHDALESLLDSFQTFVKRQKTLGYQAENYLNLIRFVRQLTRLAPGDAAARRKLADEIEATAALAEKKWLLSRISALV